MPQALIVPVNLKRKAVSYSSKPILIHLVWASLTKVFSSWEWCLGTLLSPFAGVLYSNKISDQVDFSSKLKFKSIWVFHSSSVQRLCSFHDHSPSKSDMVVHHVKLQSNENFSSLGMYTDLVLSGCSWTFTIFKSSSGIGAIFTVLVAKFSTPDKSFTAFSFCAWAFFSWRNLLFWAFESLSVINWNSIRALQPRELPYRIFL